MSHLVQRGMRLQSPSHQCSSLISVTRCGKTTQHNTTQHNKIQQNSIRHGHTCSCCKRKKKINREFGFSITCRRYQRMEKMRFEAYRKLATMPASSHKWYCLCQLVEQGINTAGVWGSIPTENNVCTQVTLSIKASLK